MIRFRDAQVDDADARELLAEYFVERVAGFPPELGAYRTAPPAPGMFADGVFLVADDDGAAVGCGGIRRLDADPPAVRYEVKHLFLRPEARGRGAGRALMEELERRARGLGATELVLDTNRVLEAAGALYARLGYVSVPPYNDNPNATDWYRKVLDDLAGMTVNERLFALGSVEAFDAAMRAGDRRRAVDILDGAELADQAADIVDRILENPAKYGYGE